ncbi:MAG: Asp-tRNA(Asn)/Glu-tRNA(Gln) amidotransferase subunit GatB [Chloroflexi bacterium]|nr:MAG: Asp-tRNA(Asn)/Glu-tRNA(Gln) amidotransferase subunit GatB [Chloroflexota bacterium]
MEYEPVIGLEVHIEMLTESKMFCACPVVDFTVAAPNTAVCPVCAGMPGTLPVINAKVVEFALRVALALECEIAPVSIFARKNYFYPDLPKGYQISQYEQPLASNGRITLQTSRGERVIRIRRVHLEEDTGKLTHVESSIIPVNGNGADTQVHPNEQGRPYSLVDLNRAGVALLEIVTEPDFRTAEEVRAYAEALRMLVRYLGVNSGDLEKGVMRIEPNISIRPVGRDELGTKVEIKNLNSFRSLERGVSYEIRRHGEILRAGGQVMQETVGWDEGKQATYSQRSKEDAHDYRYFPEPDLPPLVVDPAWVAQIRQSLPELPQAKIKRFQRQYGLSEAESTQLVTEKSLGEYYEKVVEAGSVPARTVFAWLTGEMLSLLNAAGNGSESATIQPKELAMLLKMIADGQINQNTGKTVLTEMFATGKAAAGIVAAKGLAQVSDAGLIAGLVAETLAENAREVESYRAGKTTVVNFLFGQVMKKAQGKANPQVVRAELERRLDTQ